MVIGEKVQMNHTTDWGRRWRNTGYITFFLSGICAISSGIIVSILQGKYEFDYGMTGTMLGLMSIGNMAASFAAGILPQKIGVKNTVLLLSDGGDWNAGRVDGGISVGRICKGRGTQ